MTLAEEYDAGHVSPSACPACAVAPSAERLAELNRPSHARLMLSLPTAHCAACMSTVENGLQALPGVQSARVNLTQRRVSVDADPDVTAASLIPVLASLGFEAHELDPGLLSATETDKQGRDLLMRLGVAGFAMMNVMLLSVAVWSGAGDATRDLFHWISAAIALPTVVFAGQPFFKSAWASLRVGRLGMDVPISLALVLASSISLFETFNSGHHAYFDAAVMLTFFLLGGRYLDHRTRAVARSAAEELAALEVPRATRAVDGVEEEVAISALAVGDIVRVRPGGRMPVDGVVTQGTSEVDRSLLTGESLPSMVAPGMPVAAGEINLTGPLLVRVTAAGRDSSLHRMADLVAVAESAKTKYTSLAERAARAYSPLVHILSFAAFGFWMWRTGGDLRYAVNISAAVLIITCPCALGLAVPAVVTAASGRLFRKGLLIKDGTALERLAEVDHVVFDKTGTLTLGTPKPVNLDVLPPAALKVALGLAGASAHPLAVALTKASDIAPAQLSDVQEVPGYGIEGRLDGELVRLGRAEWVGATPAPETATYLSLGGQTHAILFADKLRPGAEVAVAAMKAAGLKLTLLSGDAAVPVADLAARIGISEWQAGQLPAEKANYVKALQDQGHKVLMIGDGLNDTAALAQAYVSISPATALDAARTASDIVLLGQDMAPVADALRIAKQSTRRIRENFALSAAYNVIAVPLALMGLATPLLAALAMSLSSITVSLNALRLR
ncbi:cadmium-translocating P-type ATPase [Pseudorhodobacter turbinis]|uniref:Cadmium-translocating P-type ATPase n=1 Tax=Pseudorhodobacter turbinis TaxID=2500533 RepID=A0A4P8EGS4_9RHOB|nr:heavy metal translocating P-type ATPase [Pseudorhodobacter turbinis]QCO56009.1 cadmium-translocating P-type ATPase [Pseudorhodobacter turbinis]